MIKLALFRLGLIIGFCWILLACQPSHKKYKNYQGFGYQINIPSHWKVMRLKKHIVLFRAPMKDNQYATLNIQTLGTTRVGGPFRNIEHLVATFHQQLALKFEKTHFSALSAYTLANQSGKQFTADYCTKQHCFRQWQLFIPSRNKKFIYAIGYTAPLKQYQYYLELIKTMLLSFRLKI